MKIYSIFISLILFLFLPEFSNCQIKFYDYSPDTVITVYENGTSDSAYFSVDLNGDSIDDIRFRLSYKYDFASPSYNEDFFVSVNSINEQNKFGQIVVQTGPCNLEGFSSGDTIGNNTIWNPHSYSYLLFHWCQEWVSCNEFSTYRYLAFTDTINSDCHFGWILLRTYTYLAAPPEISYVSLVVKEFAYNKDPGYGIIAGDTMASIPVSIDNPLLSNEPIYYPNPTSGKLYIKESVYEKIEIFNLIGNVILESKNNEIDLTEYPDGLYFIRFYYEEKLITGKIIKK